LRFAVAFAFGRRLCLWTPPLPLAVILRSAAAKNGFPSRDFGAMNLSSCANSSNITATRHASQGSELPSLCGKSVLRQGTDLSVPQNPTARSAYRSRRRFRESSTR
jgi:hypothetical protein